MVPQMCRVHERLSSTALMSLLPFAVAASFAGGADEDGLHETHREVIRARPGKRDLRRDMAAPRPRLWEPQRTRDAAAGGLTGCSSEVAPQGQRETT